MYEVPDGVVVHDGFYLREAWDRVWEARLEIEERLGREGFPARDAERVEVVGLGDGFGVTSLVGDFHSVGAGDLGWCGVRTDLSAACWGLNTAGRLDAPPGEFWEVGIGDRFACGLEAEGAVTCWGDDSRGRLDAPDGVFLDLAVGDRHGCAVGLEFGLACWGYDNAGQASPPGGLFDSVTAGGDYSCAIAVDRTAKCWGRATNDTAEPPDGAFSMVDAGAGAACGLRYDGGAVCWGGDLEAPDGVFADLAVGGAHACGLRPGGLVQCWGNNTAGETNPIADRFSSITAARGSTCALGAEEGLVCWGEGASGTLLAPHDNDWVSVTAGGGAACAARDTSDTSGADAARCWGVHDLAENQHWPPHLEVSGPLECLLETGLHTQLRCAGIPDMPTEWLNSDDYKAVSLRLGEACALSRNSELACVIYNEQPEKRLGEYTAITAGEAHTCTLTALGHIRCWGTNTHGQTTPPPGGYTTITAGARHNCAINTTTNTTVCWGDNTHNQSAPPTNTTFTQLAAGDHHTCGLQPNGTTQCWGNPHTGAANPPGNIFTTITAGDHHTCGLQPNGTIQCWGGPWKQPPPT